MLKTTQLKLSKIKYSGDSIGDDIRAEIKILDKTYSVDKRIKKGTTAKINEEIGNFKTDQKIFTPNIKITVIEKDFLYNDVGSIESNIKINTNITKPQQFTYIVKLRETRTKSGKPWGKRTAIFEITLEANVSDLTKYTPETEDGWIITQDSQGKRISLPAYLKIKGEYIKNKREYFAPLEGTYRGQLLSIELPNDDSSHFISNVKHTPMVRTTYSISKKVFTLSNKKYQAIDHPDTPWKKGLYDIEIPDHPHGSNNRYSKAKKQKVWFRIGHSGKKYLHVGSQSRGCMTITEVNKWMNIYNALIRARKGDYVSVGVVEVID